LTRSWSRTSSVAYDPCHAQPPKTTQPRVEDDRRTAHCREERVVEQPSLRQADAPGRPEGTHSSTLGRFVRQPLLLGTAGCLVQVAGRLHDQVVAALAGRPTRETA
jgi:hypothetical protein